MCCVFAIPWDAKTTRVKTDVSERTGSRHAMGRRQQAAKHAPLRRHHIKTASEHPDAGRPENKARAPRCLSQRLRRVGGAGKLSRCSHSAGRAGRCPRISRPPPYAAPEGEWILSRGEPPPTYRARPACRVDVIPACRASAHKAARRPPRHACSEQRLAICVPAASWSKHPRTAGSAPASAPFTRKTGPVQRPAPSATPPTQRPPPALPTLPASPSVQYVPSAASSARHPPPAPPVYEASPAVNSVKLRHMRLGMKLRRRSGL